MRTGTRAKRYMIVRIGHNQNKPREETGNINPVLMDEGDLAPSSI